MSAQNGQASGELSGRVARTVMAVVNPDFGTLSASAQAAFIDNMQYITRKAGHFGEYALLGLLIYLALGVRPLRRPARFSLAFFASALYAATDELHQMGVAGRSPQVTDVLIDAAGALFGVALAMLIARWLDRRWRVQA